MPKYFYHNIFHDIIFSINRSDKFGNKKDKRRYY